MLKQFKQLALETEGRYASDRELQFLKDYLNSAEARIDTYEKIRDQEEALLDEVETVALENQSDAFIVSGQNRQINARRDCKYIMRNLAVSTLANDLERYRDGLLVWHRAIMNANKFKRASQITRDAEFKVLEKNLSETEFSFVKPALMIGKSFLT